MNTNNQPNEPAPSVPTQQTPEPANPAPASNNNGQALVDLADALNSVDPKASDAQANATSISDNNGGRIELNQDKINTRAETLIIKK